MATKPKGGTSDGNGRKGMNRREFAQKVGIGVAAASLAIPAIASASLNEREPLILESATSTLNPMAGPNSKLIIVAPEKL